MFWKIAMMTSRIETLLEKDSVSLKELLDEDDVLQECKAQNRRLVNFLVREENLSELIRLATTLPEGSVSDSLRFKYTNIACELLTSDVITIIDAIVNNPRHMDTIFDFLENAVPAPSIPLAPVLAATAASSAPASGSSTNSPSPSPTPQMKETTTDSAANAKESVSANAFERTSETEDSTRSSENVQAPGPEGDSSASEEARIATTIAPAQLDSDSRSKTNTNATPAAPSETSFQQTSDLDSSSKARRSLAPEQVVETTLNPLMASFFTKIINQLLTRRTMLTINYLRTKRTFIQLLMKHISTPAIVDVLIKLFSLVETNTPEARTAVMDWLLEEQLFERLLGAIDAHESEWVHANAAHVACEAIRLVREQAALLLPDSREKSSSADRYTGASGSGAGTGSPDITLTPTRISYNRLEALLDRLHSFEVVSLLLEHMFGEKPSITFANKLSAPPRTQSPSSPAKELPSAPAPLVADTDSSATPSESNPTPPSSSPPPPPSDSNQEKKEDSPAPSTSNAQQETKLESEKSDPTQPNPEVKLASTSPSPDATSESNSSNASGVQDVSKTQTQPESAPKIPKLDLESEPEPEPELDLSADELAARKQSVLVNGLQIIFQLLDFRKPDPISVGFSEGAFGGRSESGFSLGASSEMPGGNGPGNGTGNILLMSLEPRKIRLAITNVSNAMRPYLARFHALLDIPPNIISGRVATASGSLPKPCGAFRLQLARVLMMVVQVPDRSMQIELVRTGLVRRLIEAFFDYAWNNFLHAHIEQMLYALLTPDRSMFSAQNLNKSQPKPGLTVRRALDFDTEAEFDFDVHPTTSRESGGLSTSGRGRSELESLILEPSLDTNNSNTDANKTTNSDPNATSNPNPTSSSSSSSENVPSISGQSTKEENLANSNPTQKDNTAPATDPYYVISHILCELELLSKILDAYQVNEERQKAGLFRLANMGHLHRIATYLTDCMQASLSKCEKDDAESKEKNEKTASDKASNPLAKAQFIIQPQTAETYSEAQVITGDMIYSVLLQWPEWGTARISRKVSGTAKPKDIPQRSSAGKDLPQRNSGDKSSKSGKPGKSSPPTTPSPLTLPSQDESGQGQVKEGEQVTASEAPANSESATSVPAKVLLCDRWWTFVNGPLEELKKRNKQPLRGGTTREPDESERRRAAFDLRGSSETSSFTLTENVPSPALQQSFLEYIENPTPDNFPEHFTSVNEEHLNKYPAETSSNHLAEKLGMLELTTEFSDETTQGQLFDQVCNERIKVMDDEEEPSTAEPQANAHRTDNELGDSDRERTSPERLSDEDHKRIVDDSSSSPTHTRSTIQASSLPLTLDDLLENDYVPDISSPTSLNSGLRGLLNGKLPKSGNGDTGVLGSLLDSDLLPLSSKSKKVQNLALFSGGSGLGLGKHSEKVENLSEMGKANHPIASGKHRSELHTALVEVHNEPALDESPGAGDNDSDFFLDSTRNPPNLSSLSGNNPFRKEAMQSQKAWVQEHETSENSSGEFVLKPKSSKNENFSFAKAPRTATGTKSGSESGNISVQIIKASSARGRSGGKFIEVKQPHESDMSDSNSNPPSTNSSNYKGPSATSARAHPKMRLVEKEKDLEHLILEPGTDPKRRGGAGSSDDEDDLDSERLFSAAPPTTIDSKSNSGSTYTKLNYIQPRPAFGGWNDTDEQEEDRDNESSHQSPGPIKDHVPVALRSPSSRTGLSNSAHDHSGQAAGDEDEVTHTSTFTNTNANANSNVPEVAAGEGEDLNRVHVREPDSGEWRPFEDASAPSASGSGTTGIGAQGDSEGWADFASFAGQPDLSAASPTHKPSTHSDRRNKYVVSENTDSDYNQARSNEEPSGQSMGESLKLDLSGNGANDDESTDA